MSLREVLVENGMSDNVWVIIAENAQHVLSTKTEKIRDYEFETYYKMMMEGKIALPIDGVPISAEGKESVEFKARLKTHWEDHQEATFEWSGFIVPGELEVAANSRNRWALKGDELPYYISIRAMGGRIVANAVARQDAVITLDEKGHISDPAPKFEPITDKAKVYFQQDKKDGGFIGDPQTANTNWDSGTFLDTGGAHHFETDSGKLESGAAVRIVSDSKTLVDGAYKYIYSSDIGWTYYDKKRKTGSRDGKKQSWKVAKTSSGSNSPGDTLHYGDRVKIYNINWPKANLGIKGKWLQCVNDDPTAWILRKERKG